LSDKIPDVRRWELEPVICQAPQQERNKKINDALTHAAVRADELTWSGGLHRRCREFGATIFRPVQKGRGVDSAKRNWVCSAKQASELRQGDVVFVVAEIAGFNLTNTVARFENFFAFRAEWSAHQLASVILIN
jgi:hypothetical protein